MTVHTHPLSMVAAEIYDQAVILIGPADASTWLLTANDGLGGRSPLQAIKDGDVEVVHELVEELK